jgi:hypothetical protein
MVLNIVGGVLTPTVATIVNRHRFKITIGLKCADESEIRILAKKLPSAVAVRTRETYARKHLTVLVGMLPDLMNKLRHGLSINLEMA